MQCALHKSNRSSKFASTKWAQLLFGYTYKCMYAVCSVQYAACIHMIQCCAIEQTLNMHIVAWMLSMCRVCLQTMFLLHNICNMLKRKHILMLMLFCCPYKWTIRTMPSAIDHYKTAVLQFQMQFLNRNIIIVIILLVFSLHYRFKLFHHSLNSTFCLDTFPYPQICYFIVC